MEEQEFDFQKSLIEVLTEIQKDLHIIASNIQEKEVTVKLDVQSVAKALEYHVQQSRVLSGIELDRYIANQRKLLESTHDKAQELTSIMRGETNASQDERIEAGEKLLKNY
ncbi:hypothetical protein [Lactococcus allomyrinae]|uniref:Uncharacterized protein n=1 Tax=Lactococcus allomyrinae TaxID=2419773 RepID=A0A387BL37_9LACT|nr:hypothetical protein [Lactococcus allomyrinae]AYG01680.1 hypothetical protein D7I46_11825 [Lactococcus allomyrinae]